MLFRLSKVAKSYAGRTVLRDVTFQIDRGERIGLVGRNGAGKTTIFELINGHEAPDDGEVLRSSQLRIGSLSQHIEFDNAQTVHDVAFSAFEDLRKIESELRRIEHELAESHAPEILERYGELQREFELHDGFSAEARCEAALIGVGFAKNQWEYPAAKLSGGQKNRLALVKLLLGNSDILLLDEPTNHLDTNATEWLESFLANQAETFLLISHDRYFLDRVCSRIIELENGMASSYKGNYSSFVRQREEKREVQRRAFENQQNLIEKTEAFVRKNLAGQKTKQAKSRRNMLERLDRVAPVENESKRGNFSLKKVERAGNQVLMIEDLSIGFGAKIIAKDLTFTLLRGDCLGVIGGNGTGKTTFLRTLIGQIPKLDGKMTWGTKVKFGYYSQQLDDLHSQNEVIGELRLVAPRADNGELRGFLARFLFCGEDVFKRVGDLSGGEKGRLAIAKLIYSQVNLLILDEPTNHLDIPSREALEDALQSYDGTTIVVSHDRFFLDQLATSILCFGDEGWEVFEGNYTEFHDRQISGKPIENSRQTKSRDSGDGNEISTPKNLSKNERRKLEERISEIEKEIFELDGQLAEFAVMMNEPAVAASASEFAKLSNEHQATENLIADLYKEWDDCLKSLGSQSEAVGI